MFPIEIAVEHRPFEQIGAGMMVAEGVPISASRDLAASSAIETNCCRVDGRTTAALS
jgi:hypothetical protein